MIESTEADSRAAQEWASRSVAVPGLFTSLQASLPVSLIATPREVLRMCRSEESLNDVMARNDKAFDFFPVVDVQQERERIVGIVELTPFLLGRPARGSVRDHMQSLSEDNLIGADAGILTFVRSADQHACRLVMSGAEISGLVSLSDLQQLPVRAALFALITHLEITMTQAIHRENSTPNNWKLRLTEGRLSLLKNKFDQAKTTNNLVDELLFTDFSDKIDIICKSDAFRTSKTKFRSDLTEARKLRDNLAHASDYATTRAAAAQVSGTVRKIENWVERLSAWPSDTNTVNV